MGPPQILLLGGSGFAIISISSYQLPPKRHRAPSYPTLKTHEAHMVDYYRRLLSCRFVYCKRAFPTPQSQDQCYYRIADSLHSRYRRLGYLEVTLLCWPIAVALVFPRLRPERLTFPADYRNASKIDVTATANAQVSGIVITAGGNGNCRSVRDGYCRASSPHRLYRRQRNKRHSIRAT